MPDVHRSGVRAEGDDDRDLQAAPDLPRAQEGRQVATEETGVVGGGAWAQLVLSSTTWLILSSNLDQDGNC